MNDKYWYLATVYRKYPDGLDAAAEEASRIAALLIDDGVPVFAPIPHGHAIARYSKIPPDSQIWADLQTPFIAKAYGLIVVRMRGWQESSGIAGEIKAFREAGKPIFHVHTDTPVENFRLLEAGTARRSA